MRPKPIFTVLAVVALLLLADQSSAAPVEPIKGIDVSRFQGKISWKKVSKTDIRFAYVQASRGSGKDCTVVPEECGRDQYFARNYANANAEGLRVGAYHRAFAKGGTREKAKEDARAEANRFINVVGSVANDDLRPALDVESPFTRLDESRLRLWIRTWLNRVEKKLNVKPLIYTNSSSWLATGNTTSFANQGHPLWVANFDVPRPSVPAENWAGKGWTIWQYTSSGRVKGVTGNVDRNRLMKGFGKLDAR
jgi:lysozyme